MSDDLGYELDSLGFYASRQLPDGRWLCVEPQLFSRARLCLVGRGADLASALNAHFGYLDTWDYETVLAALTQLFLWDGAGEPRAWSRHFRSGRRRQPDGSIAVRTSDINDAMLAELRTEVLGRGAGHECDEWWGEAFGKHAGVCVLCGRARGAAPAAPS